MKTITSFLTESNISPIVDNIIIGGSGSMSFIIGKGKIINKIVNKYPNAKLYVHDTSKDKVVPLSSINDYKAGGPHSADYKGVAEFLYKHVGELTMFLQN